MYIYIFVDSGQQTTRVRDISNVCDMVPYYKVTYIYDTL